MTPGILARGAIAVLVMCAASAASLLAQPAPITLPQAVTRAVGHYPAVRAAAAQIAVASANAVWQVNRSTRNNISGLVFPQPVVSPISGPVSLESNASIWNHALGVLVT